MTRRLESVLNAAGIKAAVLTTQTPPEDREAWYERQLKADVQAFIGHPRLVQAGIVMHQGVGQSADEVWRALQVQQPSSQTPEPSAPEPVPAPPIAFVPRSVPSLVFGQDVPTVAARRRVGSAPSSDQLPLF